MASTGCHTQCIPLSILFVTRLLRLHLPGMLITHLMQLPHSLPAPLPTLPAALPACSMEILTIVVPQCFLIMGSIANMIKGECLGLRCLKAYTG